MNLQMDLEAPQRKGNLFHIPEYSKQHNHYLIHTKRKLGENGWTTKKKSTNTKSTRSRVASSDILMFSIELVNPI